MEPAPVLTAEECLVKFKEEVLTLGIDGQAKYFLCEFVADFAGNFEEVLELAEEFKSYAPEGVDAAEVRELEKDRMHLFLEKRGETLTVVALQTLLKEVDIDTNGKVAFIEYCLFKYKKTLGQLFAEKPENLAALLRQLEAAIEVFQAVVAKRTEDDDKIKDLTAVAESGTGPKAMKAKIELEQMRARSNTGQNVAEVRASFKKKQAKKALDEGDPMADEMKRLEIEKKKKDEEEAAAKQASKDRLKAKAAFLEGGGGAQ